MNIVKENIIKDVKNCLMKSGFLMLDCYYWRALIFDIIAKRENILLLIKVKMNIDVLTEEETMNLRILAKNLGASPIIIGVHSGSKKLEGGIVYGRFGLPIITKETMEDLLINNNPPYVFTAPGGLFVKISATALHDFMKKMKYTRGQLAKKLGVTRTAVLLYERGGSATLDVAIKIEEDMDSRIIQPTDPFKINSVEEIESHKNLEKNISVFPEVTVRDKDEFTIEIIETLTDMGCKVVTLARCPFNAVTLDKKVIMLTGISQFDKIGGRAKLTYKISKFTSKKSFFIVEKIKKDVNIDGIPLVTAEELHETKKASQLRKLIDERELKE